MLILNNDFSASNFSNGKPIQNCENRLIDALRLLLLLLPALDRCLARRLLLLLHRTSLLESSNRMSPSALSTMFSPHVMCPRRVLINSFIFNQMYSFLLKVQIL